MNLWHLPFEDWTIRFGWTVLHSVWQGTIIAGALAMGLAFLRQCSAQARYVTALIAMGAVLASAIATFAIVPGLPVGGGAPQASLLSSSAVRPSPTSSTFIPPIHTQLADGPQMPRSKAQPLFARAESWLAPALPVIARAWAMGVLLLSLWNLGGWIAAQRLRVIGIRSADQSIVTLSQSLARRLGMRKPVKLAISLITQTPMVIGWIRPVLLLPAALLSGLTPRQIEGILAHELAHIRRHDYLINLLQVLAETLLFYHPAVWWISRRVRLEREQCCDEIAVALIEDRCTYAESLAAIEQIRLGTRIALAARGSGRGELLRRIRSILRLNSPPPRRTARLLVAAALLLLAATIPVTLLRADPAPTDPTSATTRSKEQSAPRLQFRLVATEAGPDTQDIKDPDSGQLLHVRRRVELDASDVKDAHIAKSPSGQFSVDMDFTPAGSEKLAALTSANMNKKLAIVFDGRVLMAPTIRAKITGSLTLSGGSKGLAPEQAKSLVDAIRSAHEPPETAPSPATTQHAAGIRADCVLTALVEGKRRLLASPTLNLTDDTDIRFLYDGKPPVIIQQQPDGNSGILASVRAQQQEDGRFRVIVRLSRRYGDDSKGVPSDEPDAVVLAREVDLVGLEKRVADAQETLARAESEKRRKMAPDAAPYTPAEVAEVDPRMAALRTDIRNGQARRNDLRSTFGENYPTVIQVEQALTILRKESDRLAEQFNREFLILTKQDGTVSSAIPIDLAPLVARVAAEKAALDEARSALRIALLRGGIQTDQTVKPGEPVAVELEDGTRLEVSVRPGS